MSALLSLPPTGPTCDTSPWMEQVSSEAAMMTHLRTSRWNLQNSRPCLLFTVGDLGNSVVGQDTEQWRIWDH